MNGSAPPGFVTVREAAKILDCSESRIYQYVKSGQLSSRRVGQHVLILSEEEVQNFRRGPAGRKRGVAAPWRRYRNQAKLLATVIHIQVRPGMQEKLQEKLDTLEEHAHTFTANVARYIIEEDDKTILLILIWKNTEMPDDTTRQHDLRLFQQAFADVLDWDSATYSLKTNVPRHT